MENRDTEAAMEEHRFLVTHHMNVSTQWATALRQVILSLSSDTELNAENAPAVLSDTEIVQLVDVSSKPIIMDSAPTLLPELIKPDPLPVPNESNVLSNNNNSTNSSANADEASNQNTSSRSGRFGRILHI